MVSPQNPGPSGHTQPCELGLRSRLRCRTFSAHLPSPSHWPCPHGVWRSRRGGGRPAVPRVCIHQLLKLVCEPQVRLPARPQGRAQGSAAPPIGGGTSWSALQTGPWSPSVWGRVSECPCFPAATSLFQGPRALCRSAVSCPWVPGRQRASWSERAAGGFVQAGARDQGSMGVGESTTRPASGVCKRHTRGRPAPTAGSRPPSPPQGGPAPPPASTAWPPERARAGSRPRARRRAVRTGGLREGPFPDRAPQRSAMPPETVTPAHGPRAHARCSGPRSWPSARGPQHGRVRGSSQDLPPVVPAPLPRAPHLTAGRRSPKSPQHGAHGSQAAGRSLLSAIGPSP